jgi:hypothetical protein
MFPTVAFAAILSSNKPVKLSMLTKSFVNALNECRIVKGAGRPNKADIPIVILVKALRAAIIDIEAAEAALEAPAESAEV